MDSNFSSEPKPCPLQPVKENVLFSRGFKINDLLQKWVPDFCPSYHLFYVLAVDMRLFLVGQ